MDCITFDYLYRDAGNYKVWGEQLVEDDGSIGLDEARERIKATCEGGEFFVPGRVGLEPLFFDDSSWDDEVDHPWHEFHGFTTADPALVGVPCPTLSELVARFEAVGPAGWELVTTEAAR